MSPVAELDKKLEQLIRELALRIVVPRWTQFDEVWEAAIRVCDRYELGKNRRDAALASAAPETLCTIPKPSTSSPALSSVDAPAQTHPPVAA